MASPAPRTCVAARPGGEAHGMIVDAGQQCVGRDEGDAGVGAHGGPLVHQERGERLAGHRAEQRAPAAVPGGGAE